MERKQLRLIEFAIWVITVSVIVILLSTIFGMLVDGSLLAVKRTLFVIGVLLFGIGSLGIQPKSPHKDHKRIDLERAGEHRVEAAIQRLPPLRTNRLPLDERIGRNVKIFVAGVVVLGVSAVLEFGFGVSV